MNILIISKDVELIEKMKKIESFKITVSSSICENSIFDEIETIVASDLLANVNDILRIKSNFRNIKIFYMISNENISSNTDILHNEGIFVIPPKKTKNQIVLEILNTIKPEELLNENNIFVFYGADSKVGTSMISQSVSEAISEKFNGNILYLFLDESGGDYLDVPFTESLDSLKVKLINNVLSEEELFNACTKIRNNFYAFKGTFSLPFKRHFNPKHIESLIEIAKKRFEIVIIDAGNSYELGLAIGALNSCPSNSFLVATQQEKTIKAYKLKKEQILDKLKITNFMLVMNKYIEGNNLISPYNLANDMQLTLVSTVSYSDFGWQSESDKNTLLKYDDVFRKEIDKLASLILKKSGISVLEKEEKFSFVQKIKNKFVR